MAGFLQRVRDKATLRDYSDNANEDLLPSPPERRTWSWWNYSSIWAGQSFDATWWNTGSAFISVGLTVKQTVAPVLIGCFLIGVAAVLNASFGAHYHVGFPAMIRPTFGVRGSKWFVGMRGLVGIIWYAVQIFYAAELFNIMCLCAFGLKYRDWNPAVPSSAGTDAKTLLFYFLAWGIALPLVLIHPSKLRWIFTTRVSFGSIALITMFVWCTILGQTDPKGFKGFDILQPAPVSGPALGWATMSSINQVLGTVAPMITNQSDVSRYARTPKQAGWPQGFAIFITKSTACFLSIISAASLQSRYGGVAKWNIWDQLELLLEENWNAKTRFGCFMIALCVCYSVIVTNVYCNTIPFGADIAALFPRYFNMIRGQIAIALISLPILPWQILANAAKFLTFLGSYTFLMGALLGCQWADFMSRKGNYHVPSMYDYTPGSLYMYSRGYNWRGFAAWTIAFAIIFPGLIAAYIPDSMSISAQRIYNMGWILGVVIALISYLVINKLFPVPMFPFDNADAPEGSKWLGMSHFHGVFPGETIISHESQPGSDASSMEEVKTVNEKLNDSSKVYTSPISL